MFPTSILSHLANTLESHRHAKWINKERISIEQITMEKYFGGLPIEIVQQLCKEHYPEAFI